MRQFLFLFLLYSLGAFAQVSTDSTDYYFKAKQFDKAEMKLLEYLKTHPNDLKALELYGDACGHQKKWDEAIASYKILVGKHENVANYQYKYGGALGMKALSVNKFEALGLIKDIEKAFLKAAKLDPQHVNTRWALVEYYMQLPGIVGGSKSKALGYAEELQKLSKVDGFLAKGYIYEYDEDVVLAEKFYKMAINEGGSLWCYDKLTSFYEKQKQPDKALSNLQEATTKHKRNALHYQMGKISAQYNIELHKGETCLNTYIQNYSPSDEVPKAWAYYRLAQIFLHKKNKNAALKYIDLAISELPKTKYFKEERLKIMRL
ncbi:tetratricopeptide repeat protein [Mariniflexile ostreae]|uniref:Tetratricopeptide repeat protein n=1 Tax=Mariniflexile ostreae TaxID=1520892 RepID=A0ABV5FCS2_9FLAO